jgi:hypothetical protein
VTYAGLILSAELRNGWNWLRRTKRGRSSAIGITVAAVIGGVPLAAGAFALGVILAKLSLEPSATFALGFSATALLMFVFGLPGIIGAFFADRQLLLFAAAPVPLVQLFAARLVQASLPAAGVGLLPLASAFGYGLARGLDPFFGLLAIVTVALTALTVVAFELCLMTFVLRVVPASRARDAASLLIALFAAGFYGLQLLLTNSGPRTAGRDPMVAVRQALAIGERLRWLPTSWPAETLAGWASGGPLAAAPWMALTVAMAATAVAAGWLLYQHTFVLGIGVFGESGATPRRRRARTWRRVATAPAPPRPVLAIAAKDFVSLRRDFKRLAGTLPALAMAVAYTLVNSRRLGGGGLWPVILPLGFIPFFVGMAVGLPAVGGEGRGMLLLSLAGLPMRRLLLAKLVFGTSTLLVTTLGAALALGLIKGSPPVELLEILLIAAWLAGGASAITVAAGSLQPNFEAENPRRGVGLGAGCGGAVALAMFAGLTYGAVLALTSASGLGAWAPVLVGVGVLLLAAGAVLVGAMLLVGVRALERWQSGD